MGRKKLDTADGDRSLAALALRLRAVRGKIVLFGGDDDLGWLGDTWEWNGASWMQQNVPGPNARYVYTMAAR